jgi:hypothetical protein
VSTVPVAVKPFASAGGSPDPHCCRGIVVRAVTPAIAKFSHGFDFANQMTTVSPADFPSALVLSRLCLVYLRIMLGGY